MAPPRRWLLVVLAVVGLTALLYASIATALSVPVTSGMEEAQRLPGAPPLAGARALVVPIADPATATGRLLVGGESTTGFPSGARNATMGRALAYVAPTANGSYVPATLTFEDVTVAANGTIERVNLTVDVTALAGGENGYIVKGDAEPRARFIPADSLLGAVARFETPATLVAYFSFGGVGFVAPLVLLIVTQRASGRPGVPGSVLGCPECRASIEPGQEFCFRCGAVLGKRT